VKPLALGICEGLGNNGLAVSELRFSTGAATLAAKAHCIICSALLPTGEIAKNSRVSYAYWHIKNPEVWFTN
jgi:hypothetical protein